MTKPLPTRAELEQNITVKTLHAEQLREEYELAHDQLNQLLEQWQQRYGAVSHGTAPSTR